MSALGRIMYAWGIVGAVWSMVTPDAPIWVIIFAGVCIVVGAHGWEDK